MRMWGGKGKKIKLALVSTHTLIHTLLQLLLHMRTVVTKLDHM